MTVYVVHAIGTGMVKIGWTVGAGRVLGRVAEMQTGCPVALEVVHTVPHAPIATEKALHKELDSFRVRGEWFRIDPTEAKRVVDAALEKIEAEAKVPKGPRRKNYKRWNFWKAMGAP